MKKQLTKWLRHRLSRRQLNAFHATRAWVAALRYGFPARGLPVIGITGTKGKTTTCHLVAAILEEAGYTVGMATTVRFKVGKEEWSNDTNKSNIPPEQLQALLSRMREAHCDILVIEVTSHGLDQNRIWGIPFRYVGLTNITHDHLDYHGTWDAYQAAKLRLFKRRRLAAAVINSHDASAERFLSETTAPRRWVYGLEEVPALPGVTDTLIAEKCTTGSDGASFTLRSEHESARVHLQLPGLFSIENALCAAALCANLNMKLATIVSGLESVQSVPGRMERVETRKGFAVVVDYAHTPDSLEKLYATLRPQTHGRLIAVLGSCGDRDRTKRPIMGALAARFCDYVFVTDEEPYTEDPQAIIEEVARGVPRGRALYKPSGTVAQKQDRPIFKREESGENDWWWKVADRREAIARAIDLAKMDDLIVITGMGAQNFKVIGSERTPWNDRQVVESLLQERQLNV